MVVGDRCVLVSDVRTRIAMLTFDHIALSAAKIDEAVSFYRECFAQTEVLYQDETWAQIKIDGLKIAFVLEEQHPPHMAFRASSREELERLATDAEAPIMLHRDGSESFYHDDPSGNVVEVIFYPEISEGVR